MNLPFTAREKWPRVSLFLGVAICYSKDIFKFRIFLWILGVILDASNCSNLGTLLGWFYHHDLCDVMSVLKLRGLLLFYRAMRVLSVLWLSLPASVTQCACVAIHGELCRQQCSYTCDTTNRCGFFHATTGVIIPQSFQLLCYLVMC